MTRRAYTGAVRWIAGVVALIAVAWFVAASRQPGAAPARSSQERQPSEVASVPRPALGDAVPTAATEETAADDKGSTPPRPDRPIEVEVIDMESGDPVPGLEVVLRVAMPWDRNVFTRSWWRRTDAKGKAQWWLNVPGRVWIEVESLSYATCDRLRDILFMYDPADPPRSPFFVEVVPKTHLIVRVLNEAGLPAVDCVLKRVIGETDETNEVLEPEHAGTFEESIAPWDRVRLVATNRFRRSDTIEFECDGSPTIEKVLTLPGPCVEQVELDHEPPRVFDVPATVRLAGEEAPAAPDVTLRSTVVDVEGRAVPECRISVYRAGDPEPLMAEGPPERRRIRGPETDDAGHWAAREIWFGTPIPLVLVLADCGTLDTAPRFARHALTLPERGDAHGPFLVRVRLVTGHVEPETSAYRAGLRSGDVIESWQGRRPLRAESVPPHWRRDVRVLVDRDGALLLLTLPPGLREFSVRRVLSAP